MCQTNSATSICGTPLSFYLDCEKTGNRKGKPTIRFCQLIHGTILKFLLDTIDELSVPIHEEANVTAHIEGALFWDLVTRCNLNHKRDDETASWDRLVIGGFRPLIKYVGRRAVAYGAVVKMPEGWTPIMSFDSAEDAGEWLACRKAEIPSAPPSPVKQRDINASMWASPSSSVARQKQLDVAMSQLSLSREPIDSQLEEILVSSPPRPHTSTLSKSEQPRTRNDIFGRPLSAAVPPMSLVDAGHATDRAVSIAEWSAGVEEKRMDKRAALERLDELGREQARLFERLVKIDVEMRDVGQCVDD